MKQLLIGGAVLLVGATGVVIAMAEQRPGPILIAGDKPVTEAQVSQKLQSEGYSNVQITRQGRVIPCGRIQRRNDGQSWLWTCIPGGSVGLMTTMTVMINLDKTRDISF